MNVDECHCECHKSGLIKATVEDVRYLLDRLVGLVGELELLVGRRPPHPGHEEGK